LWKIQFFETKKKSRNKLKNSKQCFICQNQLNDEPYESSKISSENLISQKKLTNGISNPSNSFSENSQYQKNFFSGFNNEKKSFRSKKNSRFSDTSKQQVVSITYEEIGLFPRSFNRVFDRFFKQLFFDVENLVIQEYRFYRYLFFTTVKCLFILIFVPLGINFLAKNYFIRPVTEYYWNTHNHEIFLNSYQQKRAFHELKNFEEKIYFESLLLPENQLFFERIQLTKKNPANENFLVQKNEIDTKFFDNSLSLKNSNSAINGIRNAKIQTSVENNLGKNALPISFISQNFSEKNLTKMSSPLDNSQKEEKKSNILKFSGYIQESSPFPLPMIYKEENRNKEKKENFLEQERDIFNTGTNIDVSILFRNSIQKRLQTKIIELANHYNEESIEAVTNFFADVVSFSCLCFLLFRLEIQINITKSFLLEVFFGLDDSKKSLLILFVTDLLVGYHSPNIWELFFQTLFDHYGLPESQTTIFLLVATLPVLLDVLFKYLIFRHLNRASPATVATYHAMIE